MSNNGNTAESHENRKNLDDLKEQFRILWRSNPTTALEDCLETTSTTDRPSVFRELLKIEVELRCTDGESPKSSEYATRFPELTGIVAEVVVDERMMASTVINLPDTGLVTTSPIASASATVKTGRFGDYDLIREIARGGMGVVYQARQRSANRIVALKMIRSGALADDEEVRRFQVEAEAAASLDHPGIVPVFEVGVVNDQQFFSMGFVNGPSLAEEFSDGPIDCRRAAVLMRSVSEAVAYAHSRGIIHRDLKPGNILVDEGDRPRVTDFGLAKRIADDSALTATGQIVGTPSYMPPEQARGDVSVVAEPADVYSLGAILFHAVTGTPPFRGASVLQTLQQVVEQDPISARRINPVVDRDLETIIHKAMSRMPTRRYASAGDLAVDLRRYLDRRPILARRTPVAERIWMWSKRNRVAASLLLVTLLTIVGTLVVTSYAAIVYRDMAETEQQLRHKMSESLYLAEMGEADDVLSRPDTQEDARNKLVHWYPGNPDYGTFVPNGDGDLRGWEWYFLFGVVDRNRIALPGTSLAVDISNDDRLGFGFGGNLSVIEFDQEQGGVSWNVHESAVTDVEFSPDGTQVATAGLDGKVTLWRVNPRQIQATLNHDSVVGSLSFNHTGKRIVTHAKDAKLRIWDLQTKSIQSVIEDDVSESSVCAVSPDSRWIAAGSHSGDDAALSIWDFTSGEIAHVLAHGTPDGPIRAISWSPDGRQVVTAADRSCRVWDVESETLVASFDEHHQQVYSVAWSPDGRTIASAGDDMAIILWNPKTADRTNTFGREGGESATIRSLAWSSRGDKLVGADERGSLEIIDFEKGRAIRTYSIAGAVPHPEVTALQWRPQHAELNASFGDQSVAWDVVDAAMPAAPLTSWNYQGNLRASLEDDELIISNDERVFSRHRVHEQPRRLSWNPRDDTLAIQYGQSIDLWNADESQAPTRFTAIAPAKSGQIDAIAWSDDGTKLVVGTSKGDLRLLRRIDGQLDRGVRLSIKQFQPNRVRTISWKPNSSMFAIGTSNGFIYLYDYDTMPTEKGEKLDDRGIPAHQAHLRTIAWSPDGTRLATAGADRTVILWNLDVDKLDHVEKKKVLTIPHEAEVREVAWSSNGKRLASLTDDGVIHVFDAQRGYDEEAYMDANPDMITWTKSRDR